MITEREFLQRARLDRATLSIWIEEEWLIPGRTAHELAFTDMDLARANLIHDLKDKMGVNDEGLGVILHLSIRCMRSDARSPTRSIPPASDGPRPPAVDRYSIAWSRRRSACPPEMKRAG